jgi:hypothetical protein
VNPHETAMPVQVDETWEVSLAITAIKVSHTTREWAARNSTNCIPARAFPSTLQEL